MTEEFKLPPLPDKYPHPEQKQMFASWTRAQKEAIEVLRLEAIEAYKQQQEPKRFLIVCPDCDGTGNDSKDCNYQCEHCHGSGRIEMDLYTRPAPEQQQGEGQEPGYLDRLLDRLTLPPQAQTEPDIRALHAEAAAMLILLRTHPAQQPLNVGQRHACDDPLCAVCGNGIGGEK